MPHLSARLTTLAALLCGLTVPPAAAETSKDILTTSAYPSSLIGAIRAGNQLPDVLSALPNLIDRYDRNGDGLDEKDITLLRQIEQANARASHVSLMLNMDLNADDKVTPDEAIASYPGNGTPSPNVTERRLQQAMRDDLNHDGEVTLNEALAAAASDNCGQRFRESPDEFLALDPNNDGRLTKDELNTIAKTIFIAFDDDKNGVISTSEFQVHSGQFRAAQRTRLNVCSR